MKLLRAHDIAPPAPRKRGRPKGSKNSTPLPINLDAVALEREKIREDAKQTARNRSLGWVQRRAAKQLVQSLASSDYQKQRKITAGAHLCRCINPACLVLFASWNKTTSYCSPECSAEFHRMYAAVKNFAIKKLMLQHAELISKRRAGTYDTPVLTPYAKCLIATAGQAAAPGLDEILHAATLAAESRTRGIASMLADGSRETRFFRREDGDTFSDFYLLGSALAAACPSRPCDHSGIRSCQFPIKRYNTTATP